MSVFDDVRAIDDLAMAGASEQSRGELIATAGRVAAKEAERLQVAVEEEKLSIQEAGNKARARMGDLQDAVALPDPAVSAEPSKPTRKTRVDKGQPRKAHVTEERTSPLTDDLRAKINATLAHGPLQLPEIAKMSWTAGLDVEALLCEDHAAFVCWNNEIYGGLPAWGTADQFDYVVGHMSVKSGNRVAETVAKFACSEYAAREAWRRLDPNADANGDRARREAGAG